MLSGERVMSDDPVVTRKLVSILQGDKIERPGSFFRQMLRDAERTNRSASVVVKIIHINEMD